MNFVLLALSACLLRLATVSFEHAVVAGWVLWALLVFVFGQTYKCRGR